MSFRGINTTVIQIRRQVFTEVARMAYANVKGEQANHGLIACSSRNERSLSSSGLQVS